jgi:hypothetical protein
MLVFEEQPSRLCGYSQQHSLIPIAQLDIMLNYEIPLCRFPAALHFSRE